MSLLPGQGSPVPPSVGHGVWVATDYAWWDLADTATDLPNSTGDLVGMNDTKNQQLPLRLPASRYAAGLGVDVDALVEANRRGDLEMEAWPVKARNADATAVRVRVSLGDRSTEMTHERVAMED